MAEWFYSISSGGLIHQSVGSNPGHDTCVSLSKMLCSSCFSSPLFYHQFTGVRCSLMMSTHKVYWHFGTRRFTGLELASVAPGLGLGAPSKVSYRL